MSIKKIVLELDKKEVTMAWDEAKRLYNDLHSIFKIKQEHYYYPGEPYYYPGNWWHKDILYPNITTTEITCLDNSYKATQRNEFMIGSYTSK